MTQSAKKQFLDPEFYFIEKKVVIGDPDFGEEIKLSQLVKKGDMLGEYPNYIRLKKKGYEKSSLEVGDFIESTENHSYIANISGYPKLQLKEQADGKLPILHLSIVPLFEISHDKMQASINIHPAIPNEPSLIGENVKSLLENEKIIFGLNVESIDESQKIIEQENFDFEKIVLAKGVYPGEGTDATIKFELEIGPLAGRPLEDGKIDFRDRKIMVSVEEGQHIATKIPAIPGSTGFNVFGEEIPPKTGKDLNIKVAGDAKFFPETNEIVSTKSGALSIVNKDTIKITTKNTIKSDVDFKTGNIESGNCVKITGSVQPGFKVDVGGDLEIGGSISRSTISTEGNCVIKGGITGQSTTISTQGDLDINFVERGTIASGGIVVIRKQSYYSDISAGLDIRCRKSSKLMGGVIIAGGNLTLGDVGADNCEPALLAAGVDYKRYELYNDMKKQLIEQQEEVIRVMQLLGRGARSTKIRKLEEGIDDLKLKLLKLNLIPGTELYSRVGKGKNREEIEDEDPLYQTGIAIENIRIEIHGTIFAGTKILLGNRSATIAKNAEKRRYRLSKNLKRIMAIPFK
ncbi:MAG: DUF342 domain-containing protein [Desulfobacteraceae bacterium]|nr:DUF342 domain-containing protein [Desulfobacteraceae bacterium]